MPSASRISASDCAEGWSVRVVSRRHSDSDMVRYSATVLEIRQLSRSFREGGRVHRVLDGLHAQIGSGERVAIMGRSGSGKSTLLNLISGIDRADNGTVSIDGVG